DPDQRYGGCQDFAEDLYVDRNHDSHHGSKKKPEEPPDPSLFFKRMYLVIQFLVIVVVLIFSPKIIDISKDQSFEKTILEKIDEKINAGQLVLPVGDSAYDLWRNHRTDKKNRRILQRGSEGQLLLQLKDRGERFFRRWQDTFAATDEAWLEASRVYEWAIY